MQIFPPHSQWPNRRRFLKQTALAPAALAGATHALTGRAEEKTEPGFLRIFDGRSLQGWHKTRQRSQHGTGGHWFVKDGVLISEQDPPGSGNGGLLLTDEAYSDFELILDLRCDWGPDSGVFLRTTEKGEGMQMYVDYHENGNVGHLRGEMPGSFAMKPFQIHGHFKQEKLTRFTTSPDGRAAKWPAGVYAQSCTPEEWLKVWKVNDWNTARIRCIGKHPRITTWINGLQVCAWDGATCPLPQYDKERVFDILGRGGKIGLQVHGGNKSWPEGTRCYWRNIRVKRL